MVVNKLKRVFVCQTYIFYTNVIYKIIYKSASYIDTGFCECLKLC